MNRFTCKWVSLLGIAAVLFAQFVVSAYACPLQFMGLDPAQAVFNTADTAPCENGLEPSALCQKHCQDEQQNVKDTAQPPQFISVAPAFVVVMTPVDQHTPAAPRRQLPTLRHATSPPLSIRNCCFRI